MYRALCSQFVCKRLLIIITNVVARGRARIGLLNLQNFMAVCAPSHSYLVIRHSTPTCGRRLSGSCPSDPQLRGETVTRQALDRKSGNWHSEIST